MQEYSTWNRIYEYIDPIAFELFGINVHWYGIMYVGAMLIALLIAKAFVKYNNTRFPITQESLDSFFIWVEIGVILGGRLGYVLIYSPHRWEYLTQPWEIFNPYYNGVLSVLVALAITERCLDFYLLLCCFVMLKSFHFGYLWIYRLFPFR